MRHTAVKYVSLALVVLFVAASVLFSGSVERSRVPGPSEAVPQPPADTRDGRGAFERYCASCHDAGEMAATFEGVPDRGLAAVEMLGFLDQHGRSSAAEDREIVAYLLQRSREGR
ncbi:MAG TPA: cytochrome c [Planctomycetota bacterium]|nr:cytochrome c [Planctomycetota bacterium]